MAHKLLLLLQIAVLMVGTHISLAKSTYNIIIIILYNTILVA